MVLNDIKSSNRLEKSSISTEFTSISSSYYNLPFYLNKLEDYDSIKL